MKYTVEGFDQQLLVEYGLDCVDSVILRWFVDFYHTGKMAKVLNDGKEYAWVDYSGLIEDLPIIRIKNDAVRKRFIKFEKCGLMEHYTKKQGGSYSCYRLTDKYERLVNKITSTKITTNGNKSGGACSNAGGVRVQTREGCAFKRGTKDYSINEDPSINKLTIVSSDKEIKSLFIKYLPDMKFSGKDLKNLSQYKIEEIKNNVLFTQHSVQAGKFQGKSVSKPLGLLYNFISKRYTPSNSQQGHCDDTIMAEKASVPQEPQKNKEIDYNAKAKKMLKYKEYECNDEEIALLQEIYESGSSLNVIEGYMNKKMKVEEIYALEVK